MRPPARRAASATSKHCTRSSNLQDVAIIRDNQPSRVLLAVLLCDPWQTSPPGSAHRPGDGEVQGLPAADGAPTTLRAMPPISPNSKLSVRHIISSRCRPVRRHASIGPVRLHEPSGRGMMADQAGTVGARMATIEAKPTIPVLGWSPASRRTVQPSNSEQSR